MRADDKAMIVYAIGSAAVTTIILSVIMGRHYVKKARMVKYQNEREWMQMFSDDLRSGKLANMFEPEFVEKIEKIIIPLRKKGFIK
jgi:hypothetical protein